MYLGHGIRLVNPANHAPPGWSASDYGTVVLDIDFSNTGSVTLVGGNIQAVSCSAGTARNFAQGTAVDRPGYTGQAFANGRQCALFNNHVLLDDAWPSDIAAGKHSVLAAVKNDAASGEKYYFDSQTTGHRYILAQRQGNFVHAYYDGGWQNNFSNANAGEQIVTFQQDSATVSEIRRNGSSLGTDTYADTAIGTDTGAAIGARYTGSTQRLLNTLYGRLLVFSPQLSLATLAEVEALMAADWGTP